MDHVCPSMLALTRQTKRAELGGPALSFGERNSIQLPRVAGY